MGIEEVRLGRAFEHVGMRVELAQQVGRAAARGADDDEVGQQVGASQQAPAQPARVLAPERRARATALTLPRDAMR